MNRLLTCILLLTCLKLFGQNNKYTVSSYLTEGTKAPNTHYIGEAWLNPLIYNDQELSYHITKATFSANSTLDWHKHNSAQVLIIVDGEAYYQEKGKEPLILKQGDVIKCEKGKEHWHAHMFAQGRALKRSEWGEHYLRPIPRQKSFFRKLMTR